MLHVNLKLRLKVVVVMLIAPLCNIVYIILFHLVYVAGLICVRFVGFRLELLDFFTGIIVPELGRDELSSGR